MTTNTSSDQSIVVDDGTTAVPAGDVNEKKAYKESEVQQVSCFVIVKIFHILRTHVSTVSASGSPRKVRAGEIGESAPQVCAESRHHKLQRPADAPLRHDGESEGRSELTRWRRRRRNSPRLGGAEAVHGSGTRLYRRRSAQ